MSTTEKMDIEERYKYLRIMQKRYAEAQKRREKQELLDEMEEVTELHRKHLITLMQQRKIERRPRQRQRGKTYDGEVDEALAKIWEAQDYICAKRLKSVLIYTAEQLTRWGEMRLSPRLKEQLVTISASSIRRHLPKRTGNQAQRARQRFQNMHQRMIPIEPIPWDIQEPGHFELDLVHHCGGDLEGEYVYTLQVVDVATGWSGRRAILGRSYIVVADALYYLAHQIPFPYRKLHPDNGSEFLNANLLRFLKKHYPDLQPTRSTPGKPNDNRFVEQKNSSLVRAFLGDVRLDTIQQTRFLNRIYEKMNLYHNYIQPVMHQVDKQWVSHSDTAGGYTRRFHDDPVPPVVRLCRSGALSDPRCAELLALRDAINPLALRRDIYADLDHLFSYSCAPQGVQQNIYQTLACPKLFPEAVAELGDDLPDCDLSPVSYSSLKEVCSFVR
jgi:hypothetical protein